jgi:hypothetical protein
MRVVATAAFGCELSSGCRNGQPKSSPLYQLGDATADQPEAANRPNLISLEIPATDDRRVVLAV